MRHFRRPDNVARLREEITHRGVDLSRFLQDLGHDGGASARQLDRQVHVLFWMFDDLYIYKYIVYDMPCLSVFFAPGPVTTIYLYPNILHLYDVHVWYMYRLQVGWWASHVLTMANGPCQVSSLARAALRSIEARPKDMDVGQNLENTESWWFMMIYDDLWWFMMIYDDLWWFMMIYDDLWWFIKLQGCMCRFGDSDGLLFTSQSVDHSVLFWTWTAGHETLEPSRRAWLFNMIQPYTTNQQNGTNKMIQPISKVGSHKWNRNMNKQERPGWIIFIDNMRVGYQINSQ